MMDIKQIQKIKEAFFKFEEVLSESTAPEELFADNPRVASAFDIVHKKLGELENAELTERTLVHNLGISLREVVEELEIIEAYIKLERRPKDGTLLAKRLHEEKEILSRLNFLFGLIGHCK